VFRDFLDLRESGSDEAVIVVPDTNALISSPDAWAYRHIGNTTTYTFVILPTVLEELDKLKMNHRDPQFRSWRCSLRLCQSARNDVEPVRSRSPELTSSSGCPPWLPTSRIRRQGVRVLQAHNRD